MFNVVHCVTECNFEEHHLCGYSNQWNPNVNWYVGGSLARDPQSNLPDDHTMNNERGNTLNSSTNFILYNNPASGMTHCDPSVPNRPTIFS